jgi:hypothetical protein
MEFIESNNLCGTLLACGGLLLRNTDLAALLSYSKKLRFFEAARERLANEAATAGEIEQTVGIVCALKVQSDEELREEAGKCAEAIAFDTLPIHKERLLTPLAARSDDLRSPTTRRRPTYACASPRWRRSRPNMTWRFWTCASTI